ncbi:MAG: hypothetical protein R3C17_00600 [Planctomycetaceae bacterium]
MHRVRDIDGGGARGEGAGYWQTKEFTARMLAGDQNKDGHLERSEAPGILLAHFEKIDRNPDGKLNPEQLDMVTDWLNFHHQPGIPVTGSHNSNAAAD